jgi:hypothetical protein
MSDTSSPFYGPLSANPGSSSGSLFSGMSTGQIAGAAGLGVGALGVGALALEGPPQLPQQFQQLEGNVPGLEWNAANMQQQAAGLYGIGNQDLAMASAGTLTAPQQAQLSQYQTGLTNQARQMFYSMGRNPDQDTSYIGATANIDAQTNAMAQQMIQTTMQMGFGAITAGNQETGMQLQFQNAADQILYQAANAQIQSDTSFNTALMSAFGALGGAAAKAAPTLLPA